MKKPLTKWCLLAIKQYCTMKWREKKQIFLMGSSEWYTIFMLNKGTNSLSVCIYIDTYCKQNFLCLKHMWPYIFIPNSIFNLLSNSVSIHLFASSSKRIDLLFVFVWTSNNDYVFCLRFLFYRLILLFRAFFHMILSFFFCSIFYFYSSKKKIGSKKKIIEKECEKCNQCNPNNRLELRFI